MVHGHGGSGAFPVDGGTLYKVTISDVVQGANDTSKTAALVESQLAELRKFVAGLHADWQGAAALEFHTLMTQYDAAAKTLHQALTDIALGLHHTANNYGQAEHSAKTMIGGVEVPLARLA